MQRQLINSRAIASVGYDPGEEILEVEFRTGSVYQYYKVPREVHQWFLRVRSKTAYLDRQIKDRYEYRRIDNQVDPAREEAELLELLQASVRGADGEDEEV